MLENEVLRDMLRSERVEVTGGILRSEGVEVTGVYCGLRGLR